MYTVSVSLHLEASGTDVNKALADFAKYFAARGHNVINTQKSSHDEDTVQVTFRVASKEPHMMFKQVETWASEGEDIPEELQAFYFDEAVYHIIAVPDQVTVVEMVEIMNFVMNAACVNRVQTSRLRNMYLADREGEVLVGEAEIRRFNQMNTIHQAINILSQKVLGADLIKLIQDKEEVTWPVH